MGFHLAWPSTMTLPIDNAPRPLCSVITILDEGRAFVHKARALPSLHDRHSARWQLDAEVRRDPHRGQLIPGTSRRAALVGRRKPLVISSVAPNNSLTAPLMHSKMPIETADRRRPRETGRVAGRETLSLSAVKEAECLSIHTENYGLSRISDQMEEEERRGMRESTG